MASSFQRILGPIDFDENSMGSLQTAAELARLASATVFVLHVVPPTAPGAAPGAVDAAVAEEQAVKERLMEVARSRLEGIHFEVLARTGDPAICIVRAAEELKADLVVIATHASRKTPRFFPGSVAERVVRESVVPVVTVRPSPNGDPDAVGAHMTSQPVTGSPDMTVAHARQLMIDNRVRSIPVVEDSGVTGILTDRDIALSDATPDTAIGMLMTRDVIAVSPRSSVREAARLLFECEVEGLPVVDDHNLVGMITRSDLLKAFSGVEPRSAHRLRSVPAKRNPTIARR